jgi:hypothetical protein
LPRPAEPPTATAPTPVTNLIPAAMNRPGNDPIFALNAEAQRRAAAGEPVINATLGALMNDDGTLAVLPSVVEALARVPARKAAAYAPIAGEQGFLRAVIQDVFADRVLAEQTVAAATPGGTGALYEAITNFLEPGQALLTTDYYWGPYHTLATQAGRWKPRSTGRSSSRAACCCSSTRRATTRPATRSTTASGTRSPASCSALANGPR